MRPTNKQVEHLEKRLRSIVDDKIGQRPPTFCHLHSDEDIIFREFTANVDAIPVKKRKAIITSLKTHRLHSINGGFIKQIAQALVDENPSLKAKRAKCDKDIDEWNKQKAIWQAKATQIMDLFMLGDMPSALERLAELEEA